MIRIDEETKIARLDTPSTSYCLGLADGRYLGLLYYGRRLGTELPGDLAELGRLLKPHDTQPTPLENPGQKLTFMNSYPFELPTWGGGNFHEAALDVRTEAGQNGLEMVYDGCRVFEGKKALPGLPASFGGSCQTLEIDLVDPGLSLRAVLSYTVFSDTDVITRSMTVKNEGTAPVTLTRALSASLMLEDRDFEVLTLGGAWARERRIMPQKLTYGGYVNESLRGESGHQSQPFLCLMTAGTTQKSGEVYCMHLVYSGCFLGKVQIDDQGMAAATIGVHPENYEWRLDPGEAFTTPEAVLTYSAEGLGKMSRTLHDFYRSHLIRSPYLHRDRPVLINNWEATYFDFDSDKLLSIVDAAAAAGIEMLVMDDGWFGRRNADTSSLGDWQVNTQKIAGGLGHFAGEVNRRGLRLGLWIEPEMVSPDSDLFRAHPDWALQRVHNEPAQGRHQLVLDLANPAVVAFLKETLDGILSTANIEYVKWDMNRALTDYGSTYLPADRQKELAHRYVLGLYALQDHLVSRFPDLLLENCSGGGARFDPGMLYFSPQIWTSDDMDPVERLAIIEGTALLYPLSTMGAHVSKNRNDVTGRTTSFADRAVMAMLGTFGYELDITTLTADELAQIPGQIARHKAAAGLIREGDYYRLASWRENGDYDLVEVAAKDGSRAVAFLFEVLGRPNMRSRVLRFEGLKENSRYEVTADGRSLGAFSGAGLMYAGLAMARKRGDFRATFLEIMECSE